MVPVRTLQIKMSLQVCALMEADLATCIPTCTAGNQPLRMNLRCACPGLRLLCPPDLITGTVSLLERISADIRSVAQLSAARRDPGGPQVSAWRNVPGRLGIGRAIATRTASLDQQGRPVLDGLSRPITFRPETMQQHRRAFCLFDERSDRRTGEAQDEIALPADVNGRRDPAAIIPTLHDQ